MHWYTKIYYAATYKTGSIFRFLARINTAIADKIT